MAISSMMCHHESSFSDKEYGERRGGKRKECRVVGFAVSDPKGSCYCVSAEGSLRDSLSKIVTPTDQHSLVVERILEKRGEPRGGGLRGTWRCLLRARVRG